MKWILTVLFLSVLMVKTGAQNAYRVGDEVTNMPLPKVLNYSSASSSLLEMGSRITLLDFFGTWCVPCIRALPHLTALQKDFGKDLSIVLISIEEEDKLKKFISNRKDFPFPVVVDEGNRVTDLFQPPSYPYTVVLGKKGQVLAVTDAASITAATVAAWMKDEKSAVAPARGTTAPAIKADPKTNPMSNTQQKSANPAVELSQQFIYAAKTDDSSLAQWKESLKNLDYNELKTTLKTDADKKAFWINIYNGFSNSLLKKNPEKYRARNRFFKARQVPVAGKLFSLDEIEHDFLRHTKIKWSLGYINKLFPSRAAKDLRVKSLDYRIHFALNCGAKSCPPIAFYNPEQLDRQLQLATKNYLTSEVDYRAAENTVYLPAIMSWFRADFGGKRGMKRLLKEEGLLPPEADPKVKFKKYNWTLELNNYKTE